MGVDVVNAGSPPIEKASFLLRGQADQTIGEARGELHLRNMPEKWWGHTYESAGFDDEARTETASEAVFCAVVGRDSAVW